MSYKAFVWKESARPAVRDVPLAKKRRWTKAFLRTDGELMTARNVFELHVHIDIRNDIIKLADFEVPFCQHVDTLFNV